MVSSSTYIDVQINGYAGCDFNSAHSSLEEWQTACERLQTDGVQQFLAAIITDEFEMMSARLAHIVEVRRQLPLVRSMLRGVHLEGPFINPAPGFVGAHPPHSVRPADLKLLESLLDAADGLIELVTLAPEADTDFMMTRFLRRQGIVVSAGHCDATVEQLQRAIDAGLTMFTHLGNACPMQLNRHDNIIQRVLNLSDQLWISFIADGVHIPFVALKNYLKCVSLKRSVITTDAMTAAGLGAGHYQLGPCSVEVDDNLAAWSSDRTHLVGSAMTMPQAARNLREHLGLADSEIKQLTYDNPLAALGEAKLN